MGADRWLTTVHAGSLSRTVTANVGEPWRAGRTHWRSLVWDPVDPEGEPARLDRFLPSLDGEIGLHLRHGGQATLVLDARYQPPGGALGAAADAIALSRVARTTIERFLEDVAAQLAAEAVLIGPAGLTAESSANSSTSNNSDDPKGRSTAGDLPDNERASSISS